MANFRTLARTVDLLGKEQIRDEVTAVSELLRNSYDADASEGLIDINTQSGRIVVWDDGCGMNESEIITNWLTLGTYSKKGEKRQETKKGRIKIGEKGIGRLAISLLGDQVLLISKREKDEVTENTWSILYLHWSLFRNENISLDQVNIPIRSFSTYYEMNSFLRNNFHLLKNELLENLNDTEKWAFEQINKIKSQIENFFLSEEVFMYLGVNENRGSGTLFYIKDIIEANYNWNIYTGTNKLLLKEQTIQRKTLRMKDLIFSFRNLIDVFDRNESQDKQLNSYAAFSPKIHIDGVALESEEWLNPEHVNLFDYALKGEIRNGCFFGTAFFQDQNSYVESISIQGVKLTTGLHELSIKDCGPIKVKWFYIEGEPYNSCLNKEQHDAMLKKLRRFGGIFVFRDGLRILPYGEEENDFLGIEYRRNLRAGDFLFAQRRMFGYLEINKKSNPGLLDKSSREGFIENEYFNYFRGVAANLLVQWATEIIGTKHPRAGRRAIRLKTFAERRYEEEKRRWEAQLEEQRQNEYLRVINSTLESFSERANRTYSSIRKEIDRILAENAAILTKEIQDTVVRNEQLFNLRKVLYEKANEIDALKIIINPRYLLTPEKLIKVEESNEQLDGIKEKLIKYVEDSIDGVLEKLSEISKSINNSNYFLLQDPKIFDSISTQVAYALQWIEGYFSKALGKIQETQFKSLKNELEESGQKLMQRLWKDFKEKETVMYPILNDLKSLYGELKKINEKEYSLDYFGQSEGQMSEIQEIINIFQEKMRMAQKLLWEFETGLKQSDIVRSAKMSIQALKEEVSPKQYDDVLIGLLKKEVDMYREVSAIGLAAEMTSHEFNALYHGIQKDLSTLNRMLEGTKLISFVDRVKKSFLSLERLHQRLSPLYRKTRYIPKEINVKQLLEDIQTYFETDTKRYKISIINQIHENLTVRESETILFTPLVNLISNAIFWLIDQKTKEIYLYMSDDYKKIYVHDSGPGVSDRDRVRIFDPYFSKKPEGRGLGLFLSRDILELKGHKLYLLPKNEEIKAVKGACFCIELKKETLIGGM